MGHLRRAAFPERGSHSKGASRKAGLPTSDVVSEVRHRRSSATKSEGAAASNRSSARYQESAGLARAERSGQATRPREVRHRVLVSYRRKSTYRRSSSRTRCSSGRSGCLASRSNMSSWRIELEPHESSSYCTPSADNHQASHPPCESAHSHLRWPSRSRLLGRRAPPPRAPKRSPQSRQQW